MIKPVLFLMITGLFSCSDSSERRERLESGQLQNEDLDRGGSSPDSRPSISTTSQSDARLVRSMAVLGDSFTLGFFQDTQLGKNLPATGPSTDFVNEIWLKGNRNFSSLAKTLTKDFSKLEGNPYAATGTCHSHACELGLSSGNIGVYAQPRATVADLTSQVRQVPKSVDYIILQVPAISFCDLRLDNYESDIQQMGQDLRDALEDLDGFENAPVVLVVPNFDVVSIFAASSPGDIAIAAPRKTTCSESRDGELGGNSNVVVFCPAMLDREFLANAQIIQKKWYSEISGVVNSFVDNSENAKFKFADSISKIKWKKSELSMDCLHPNAIGLEQVAEKTWEAVSKSVR